MSIHANVLGSMSPTAPPLGLHKRPSMRLASLTQSFFLRGDEQEASEYKDLSPEFAGPASADLQFDSFDKIPRRRRPVFAMAGLMSLLAIGAVSWRIARGHPSLSPSVTVIAVAMADHPVGTQAGGSSRLTSTPAAAAAAPVLVAVVSRPAGQPMTAEPAAPAPSPKARTVERTARPIALHGFVWSANANALVPVEGADVESKPSAATVPEPNAAPQEDLGTDLAAAATETGTIQN
jgi:hypothetical protein